MANRTVAAGEIGIYDQSLAASPTTDTVTFADHRDKVRVTIETGTTAIFFTTDGSTPTVGGKATNKVPGTAGTSLTVTVKTGGPTAVQLISSGAVTYSVVGSV